MTSFQAKMGRERLRKREKKKIVPITSYLTRNRKLKRNRRKFKKFKNIVMASFQAKTGQESQRKKEKKNYRSDQFQPNQEQKITKKWQKNSKN